MQMGVDNGDDGEIDTGDDDDFTVVKIRMTTLTMKTVIGEEGRQRMEKKEGSDWRRRKTTNGEEGRQRKEKKEDNKGEDGRQ